MPQTRMSIVLCNRVELKNIIDCFLQYAYKVKNET